VVQPSSLTLGVDGKFMQLVRGKAEIFGAELVVGKNYLFGVECKAAVFTWRGCTIEMSHEVL